VRRSRPGLVETPLGATFLVDGGITAVHVTPA